MVTEKDAALEVDPSLIGTLELEGFQVPYLNLEDTPLVRTHLRMGGTEYVYDRSYPIKGHSAVMPSDLTQLQAEGRRVLVAERGERYYVYLA